MLASAELELSQYGLHDPARGAQVDVLEEVRDHDGAELALHHVARVEGADGAARVDGRGNARAVSPGQALHVGLARVGPGPRCRFKGADLEREVAGGVHGRGKHVTAVALPRVMGPH